MAKKSKTQRAKASAARQARKQEREVEEQVKESSDATASSESAEKEEKKPGLFKKKTDTSIKAAESESKKPKKVEEKKPKKKRFQFFRDVKAELKRVTWPTKTDVLRWSGVVVAALIFFGVFVAILDNFIITPLLVLISGADPSTIDWLNFLTGGEGAGVDASGVDASGADASGADTSGADASVDTSTTDTSTDGGAEAPTEEQ